MPKAIKKKAGKKEGISEVEIQDALAGLKDTVRKKQKTALIYGLIGLSAVLVFAVIIFSRHTADLESRELENKAYNIYHNLYQKKDISKNEQYQQALELFQQAYSKQKSPRALLYIANSYFELEKYDEALKTLNDFTKKHANAKKLFPIAYQKIAAIQLIKNDKEAALKTLDSLYKSGTIYQDYALIESGRILEKEGKKAEATAKFTELAEKFPGSPFAEEARAKLAEKKKD